MTQKHRRQHVALEDAVRRAENAIYEAGNTAGLADPRWSEAWAVAPSAVQTAYEVAVAERQLFELQMQRDGRGFIQGGCLYSY